MKKLKTTVTNEERRNAKEEILKTISSEFEGTEITTIFVMTLLKEVISDLEKKALDQKFENLIYSVQQEIP
jgi:hypothetical protein